MANSAIAVILGLLLLSGSALASSTNHGTASMDLGALESGIRLFHSAHNRWPTQDEGLAALVERPGNIPESAYRQQLRYVPKDPWGNDYVYRFPGIRNQERFDLYCLGEDGLSKSGGNDRDDINNWDETRSWERYYRRLPAAPLLFVSALTVVGTLIVILTLWTFKTGLLGAQWRRAMEGGSQEKD